MLCHGTPERGPGGGGKGKSLVPFIPDRLLLLEFFIGGDKIVEPEGSMTGCQTVGDGDHQRWVGTSDVGTTVMGLLPAGPHGDTLGTYRPGDRTFNLRGSEDS
ncbi:hypothetical protein [Actinacidiphila paucisporea]|uniref:Uncharacterized protein n=1 Tax=Actinacidiphila paucisporea TaxID=310782 RepID=A0A1M7H8Z9_9ACTN|nr:hypothetical protein [Actinacidiphila paucisporea]SHM24627.1 hypothetical protein SAMN05216499_109188 [Actinacidiphila paucisporea]